MSRLIDAPRDLVWEAMTKPEHVVHWWGPNGFTNTLEKLDVRVGGLRQERGEHGEHGALAGCPRTLVILLPRNRSRERGGLGYVQIPLVGRRAHRLERGVLRALCQRDPGVDGLETVEDLAPNFDAWRTLSQPMPPGDRAL